MSDCSGYTSMVEESSNCDCRTDQGCRVCCGDNRAVPSVVSAGSGAVHLVSAAWEFEGCADIVAFHDREKAEAFATECEEYQKTEPDDDNREWLKNHPAYSYLNGDTLTGVESFVVLEIKVI